MTSSTWRAGLLVVLAATAAYANSVGNGFAYDDNWVVASNEIVTQQRFGEMLGTPYWPGAVEGTGNYRPLTIASFAAEWRLFDGAPWGFHAVSVLAHAGVSLLVFLLATSLTSVVGGAAAGLFFAVHPVHVEAVANVVGRSELYAALFVLLALLVYRHLGGRGVAGRATLLALLPLLYALGLVSKETAVTLPGLLVAMMWFTRGGETGRRIREAVPVLGLLATVLLAYLVVRTSVLGVVTGESPASGLRGLNTVERILTALTIWPHYLRLTVWPADLSIDYQPAVLEVARTVTPMVVLGAAVLTALVGLAWRFRRDEPVVGLGIAWFIVAVLPVSNLLVRSDILLAERTLYLPSVGAALVVGAVAHRVVLRRPARRELRAWGALAAVAFVALMARTVTRNPTWMDTFTALAVLAEEHPESYMAVRARALGLERVGAIDDAADLYELAMRLVPDDYSLMVEAADFYGRNNRPDRAEELLRRAVDLIPGHPAAYQRLAVLLIKNARAKEGHHAAAAGIGRARRDRQLWSLLSEAYIAGSFLEAAVRAREAALGVDPRSREDWVRLADLLDALERPQEAARARTRAEALPEEPARGGGS